MSEVRTVIEQNERIYQAFRDEGLAAELIQNPHGEAVATIYRGIDPRSITTSATVSQLWGKTDGRAMIDRLTTSYPTAGSMIYPPEFLAVTDMVMRAAAGSESSGLATQLGSSPRLDGALALPEYGLGMHADFVGTNQLEDGRAIYGLNQHYTRVGRATVRLGLLRTFDPAELLAAQERDVAESTHMDQQTAAYERLSAPFCEPFEVGPGDLLIFQAGQHTRRNLVGTAHDFVTTEPRRSSVFTPNIGEAVAVQTERDVLAQALNLQEFGY